MMQLYSLWAISSDKANCWGNCLNSTGNFQGGTLRTSSLLSSSCPGVVKYRSVVCLHILTSDSGQFPFLI